MIVTSKTTIIGKNTRLWELWRNLLKTQALFEKYFNYEIRPCDSVGRKTAKFVKFANPLVDIVTAFRRKDLRSPL